MASDDGLDKLSGDIVNMRALNMRFVAPADLLDCWHSAVELELAYQDEAGLKVEYDIPGFTIRDMLGRWQIKFISEPNIIMAKFRGEEAVLKHFAGPFKFWFKDSKDEMSIDGPETCSVAMVTRTKVYEKDGNYEFGITLLGKVEMNIGPEQCEHAKKMAKPIISSQMKTEAEIKAELDELDRNGMMYGCM